ncbi:MAG TPA: hypothetical protein VMW69_15645, partial [Spirochaetia bacterium]|nr:hypothetical protein [Spirochaetia bacterium]
MLNLFGRSKPDPTSIVTERWETKFFWKQRSRFREEQSESYEAVFEGRELVLRLKRENLFAWVNDPLYRYRDFVLEADLELDPTGAHSSAGLIFRYVNESTYYYFLVSTRGYFRFDVVFNGNPMRLIDWTELPLPASGDTSAIGPGEQTQGPQEFGLGHTHKLRVVANGSRFTLCCDEQWV